MEHRGVEGMPTGECDQPLGFQNIWLAVELDETDV